MLHPDKLTRALFLIVLIGVFAACSLGIEDDRSEHLEPAPPTTTDVSATSMTGTETSSVPVAPAPTIPKVISGYGDFTGIEYTDMDWHAWAEAVVQCLKDQGLPVPVASPGDGVDFMAVPSNQQPLIDPLHSETRSGSAASAAQRTHRDGDNSSVDDDHYRVAELLEYELADVADLRTHTRTRNGSDVLALRRGDRTEPVVLVGRDHDL